MNVNSTGSSSISMSIVAQAMAVEEEQLEENLNLVLLSNALDFQEEMATELLKIMGIGQNVRPGFQPKRDC